MKTFVLAAVAVVAAAFLFVAPVSAQFSYGDDPYSNSVVDATGYAALGTGVWLMFCCIGLVSFGVQVALTIYVYKDAEKNQVENPILWAVITFFFTLIGLLIYFLAIRPEAIKKMSGEGSSQSHSPRVEKDKE